MAKVFPEITEHIQEWIGRQALFFVATAPLAGDGHVNVSPKGPIGSLAVLDPHTVAFADASIPEARRSIVLVDVTRVGDSCGYGVPLMSFEGRRDHHALSSAKKARTMGVDDYRAFQRERGAASLDNLPALG